MLDDLENLALSRTEPVSNGIRQYNDMGRAWDTSKYHPKLSVSKFKVKVVQNHEFKEKSNYKYEVRASSDMFLGPFFFRIAKNGPRTPFERPKSDKFGKSG